LKVRRAKTVNSPGLEGDGKRHERIMKIFSEPVVWGPSREERQAWGQRKLDVKAK